MPLHEEELQAWHRGTGRTGLLLSGPVGTAVFIPGNTWRQWLCRGRWQDISVPWQSSETRQDEFTAPRKIPPTRLQHPGGSITRNEAGPCLTAPAACVGANFFQSTDGRDGPNGPGPGDAVIGNGKSGTAGDHNFPDPVFSGFTYFGGGSACGSSGGTAENGGSPPNNGQGADGTSAGTSNHPDGTSPAFGDPGSGTTPPFNQPPISQFFPGDPPGPANPDTSTGAPQFSSSDPPAGSDTPDPPISVPKPSTLWLFAGNLASALTALRLSRRARPGQSRR
jgi:hypothetical protein